MFRSVIVIQFLIKIYKINIIGEKKKGKKKRSRRRSIKFYTKCDEKNYAMEWGDLKEEFKKEFKGLTQKYEDGSVAWSKK